MEGVLRAPAMGRRIGERTNYLQQAKLNTLPQFVTEIDGLMLCSSNSVPTTSPRGWRQVMVAVPAP
jgi:hypothetical protein